jgi:A/G-specific adenine glycosylase
MSSTAEPIAPRLLAWFDRHGRHDLPWQRDPTPYSVWVSEIMLQQTQVATVVRYYERFMRAFPDVRSLAAAELDRVLALWAGLGYYARARNLHRAARVVIERYGGSIPEAFDELVSLPGIGRSTAGAVLSLSSGQRWPILDGNAKRVLARYYGIDGWPGDAAVQSELWHAAERETPRARVAAYTQAIMDLGATLCTRVRPACTVCPLATTCRACRDGMQALYPAPRPKRARPLRRAAMLVARDPEGRVLLERRAENGVWGGLYGLPELGERDSPSDWCRRVLGIRVAAERRLPAIEHAFTHFDLVLEPVLAELADRPSAVMDRPAVVWYNPCDALDVGVPAPIATLLASLVERAAPDASGHEGRRQIA